MIIGLESRSRALLWPRGRNTLLLTGVATVVAWLMALPLGMWSAAHRGGWEDRLCMGTISGLLAIPEILLALDLLAAMRVLALGACFFAPYGPDMENRELPFAPPTRLRVSPNVLAEATNELGNFHPTVPGEYTLWNADQLFLRREQRFKNK